MIQKEHAADACGVIRIPYIRNLNYSSGRVRVTWDNFGLFSTDVFVLAMIQSGTHALLVK